MKLKGLFVLIFSLLLSLPSIAANPLKEKIALLQDNFCSKQKEQDIEVSVERIVNMRINDLAEEDKTGLPPVKDIVASIKEDIWKVLRIDLICLDKKVKGQAGVGSGSSTLGLLGIGEAYSFNTWIHEAGHYVFVKGFIENSRATLTVVKFDTIMKFFKNLFSGNASWSGFLKMITPFEGIASGGGMVTRGWVSYYLSGGYTALGASLGQTTSGVIISMAGVIFTSLAQISGVVAGLAIKDRYPALGYGLIISSAVSYTLELINWTAIAFMGEAAAGSDLAKTAALLGVAPAVIPALMIGTTAVLVTAYILIKKYKDYRKHLKISSMSLFNEGILEVLKGKEGKTIMEELWIEYKRKDKLDAAVENLYSNMEKTLQRRMEMHAEAIKTNLKKKTTGEKVKSAMMKIVPTKAKMKKFVEWFKQRRAINKYQKEMNRFYRYIAKSKKEVVLANQGEVGKHALSLILQGRFLTERTGKLKLRKRNLMMEERKKAVEIYLLDRETIPIKTLVKANIKRIKYTDKASTDGARLRWIGAIPKPEFQMTRKAAGAIFTMKHPIYTLFMRNLVQRMKLYLHDFAEAQSQGDQKAMKKAAKKILKKSLRIPKKRRNIDEVIPVLTQYAQYMREQRTNRITPLGLLEVTDEVSCKREIQFVCHMSDVFFSNVAKQPQPHSCELDYPDDCYEFMWSKGLLKTSAEKMEKEVQEFLRALPSEELISGVEAEN